MSFVTDRAPWAADWLALNPMVPLSGLYRWALMGEAVGQTDVVGSIAWAVGIFVLGIVAFVRYEGNMVRHI